MENLIYTRRTPNESICLEHIMNHDNLSRADLSVMTGLTKATVSEIVKKLIEEHLVIETGSGNSTIVGGRKPINLQFNQISGLSISIDIGYNYINGLLTYLNGEEVKYIEKKPITLNEKNLKYYLNEIMSDFEKIVPKSYFGIIGVAVAVHGPVYNGDLIFTPHSNLEDIPFKIIAEEISSYPVHLENESNLSALGEYTFTSDSSDLVSVNIHSGIGAGIIQKGALQIGAKGYAGEIGHQIVALDGKACRCGNKGCLEMYASNKVCFENFAKLKNLDYVNAKILRDFYQLNDPDAVKTIEENIQYLSIGINNLVAHYNPDTIVLNSSIYREIPEAITQLKKSLKNRITDDVVLRNSSLHEKATLLGGLALNLQNFLNVYHVKFPNRKKQSK